MTTHEIAIAITCLNIGVFLGLLFARFRNGRGNEYDDGFADGHAAGLVVSDLEIETAYEDGYSQGWRDGQVGSAEWWRSRTSGIGEG